MMPHPQSKVRINIVIYQLIMLGTIVWTLWLKSDLIYDLAHLALLSQMDIVVTHKLLDYMAGGLLHHSVFFCLKTTFAASEVSV